MDSLCKPSPDRFAVFCDDAALDRLRALRDLLLVHDHHGQGQAQEGAVSAFHASGVKSGIVQKFRHIQALVSRMAEHPDRLVLRDRREKFSNIYALFPGLSLSDRSGLHVRLLRILQVFHQLVLRDI